MKAIVQPAYGSPDVLEYREVGRPHVGPGEVLVRVRAAGVSRNVWHFMTGLPYLARLFMGLRTPRARILGVELAGEVEAVGSGVTRFHPGDQVFGVGKGAYAEYALAKQDKLVLKPAAVTFEQAASVPISAVTALKALRDVGKVRPGQKVLVIGAGGGVGMFAVQLAKEFGAEVTGVCSTSKADLVRGLGADEVVDYTREDFADGKRHFDLILDAAGNRSLAHLRRALTPKGTIVFVGGEEGGKVLGGMQNLLGRMLLGMFLSQNLRGLFAVESREALQTLAEYLEAGTIAPVVGKTYPLAETAEAIRDLEAARTSGRVVITV